MVLFMIAEWMLTLHRTGLPYVVLLIDDSASMGIVDRYDDAQLRDAIRERVKKAGFVENSRINLARLILEDKSRSLRFLSENYKLRTDFVADSARPVAVDIAKVAETIRDAEPEGETTRLGQGLRNVLNELRGVPGRAAVILLSDGVTTEGETLTDAATYARRRGVPILASVWAANHPPRTWPWETFWWTKSCLLTTSLTSSSRCPVLASKIAWSNLWFAKDTSEPLVDRTVTVSPDGQQQKLRIPFRPGKVGDYEFAVEVERLPEEIRHDNNRLVQTVHVRDEPIRVLLVQERPSYEFRFLKERCSAKGLFDCIMCNRTPTSILSKRIGRVSRSRSVYFQSAAKSCLHMTWYCLAT